MQEPATQQAARLTEMPIEILCEIVRFLTPDSIGWDRKMDFWPSRFLEADHDIDTGKEIDEPTSLRDHPLRVKYMAGMSDLVHLAVTCRTFSIIAREALYSRIRIDNRKALGRLALALVKNTDTMKMNTQFIRRLELDLNLEDEESIPWWDLPLERDEELEMVPFSDLAPHQGSRFSALFRAPVFEVPSLLRKITKAYQCGNATMGAAIVEDGGGPEIIIFFITLCYLPALKRLTLRYPETHDFLKEIKEDNPRILPSYGLNGPVFISNYRLPYCRSLFKLISDTRRILREAGITPETAAFGTWPCPSLQSLEVYGQPFPWDCGRSVEFPPAWTFHTFPGLQSLKMMAMGNAGPRSPADRDDSIDGRIASRTEFWPQDMHDCMANLGHFELHNTSFQFSTFSRALAEAKSLKSLSIHIDIANMPDDLVPYGNDSPNCNTILPQCADTLEDLNLLLSCSWLAEETQEFFFGTAKKLTCLTQLPRLTRLRVNLRTLFGASWVLPNGFEHHGVDYEEYYDLIRAAEDVQLPPSLENLTLVEERDHRVYWSTLGSGPLAPEMTERLEGDIPLQQGMCSEQLKRFAVACRKGKELFGWRIKKVTMLAWWPDEGDEEAGLDREGVAEAFDKVPGLSFNWGWLDGTEISFKGTMF